jgi:hypothetical protein
MLVTVGIVAREYDDATLPFGVQTIFFEDMIKESQDISVEVVVFSPNGWHEGEFEVNGFIFRDKTWLSTRVSIPEIIYDRFISNSSEDKENIIALRSFLSKNNFRLTTPFELVNLFNNKIKFCNFLYKNNLPTLESILIKDASEDVIKKFIAYNNCIYIKPVSGLKGKDISIVKKHINGQAILHLTAEYCIQVPSNELLNLLKARFDQDTFLLQPKAKVIDFDYSLFDVRVIVQNQGNANYEVTGMGVRVGSRNAWVTNMNYDAKAMSIYELKNFYQAQYGKSIDLEVLNIKEICLECCKKLHEQFGNFAEVGFDILLTLDKGPVILEGNSKPGRWMFNSIAHSYQENSENFLLYKDIRRRSVRLPLVFALNNHY